MLGGAIGAAVGSLGGAFQRWLWSVGSAGRGTSTLPEASMRYQPLKTTRGVVGVLGVKPVDPSRRLTREQLRTLEAFANHELPFENIVEALHPERDASRTPLFQVMVALQNGPKPLISMPFQCQ